jgi:hypothetical protein
MKKFLALFVAAFVAITPALAQNNFPTVNPSGAANQQVPGVITMCLNASGQAVPLDALGLNCGGDSGGNGPPGSVQTTGVFSGADTTTAGASLAATANKTNYLCGVNISGLGATAATTVVFTITGLIGGNTLSYSYVFVAGVALPNTPVPLFFTPCIAASAVNSAITVTVPGAAGNTATQINVNGFRQ